MKLQIESVEFKNFLSFGSRSTVVPFLPGVNLVSGIDMDRQKSNGAGKSSFLETVPFALFGQVHRNIKKEQIINWKNRRNCEVILTFKKGDSVFSVLRAIKPDNFEIYQDGTLIDKPSHVKDYQITLNEIIGLNFPTFMSLIHSNINSSAKILSMKKPDKRKFMETMFGLSLYTKLNEKCNSKLKNINDKVREIDLTILTNQKIINECDKRILEFNNKIRNIRIPENELKEAKENLKDLESDFDINSNELESIKSRLDQLELDREQWMGIRTRTANICMIGLINKLKYIRDEFRIREAAQLDLKKLKELEEEHGTLDELKDKHKEVQEEYLELAEARVELMEKKADMIGEVEKLKYQVLAIERKLNMIDDGKCPTCGTEFNDPDLYEETKNEFQLNDGMLSRVEQERDSLALKISNLVVEADTKKGEVDYLVNIASIISDISNTLSHIKPDEVYSKLNDDIVRYEKTLQKLNAVRDKAESIVIQADKDCGLLEERKEELKYWLSETIELERKIKDIQKDVDLKTDMHKQLLDMVHKEEMNMKKLNQESRLLEAKKSKFVEIKDYLTFVKFLCEDKNLKQHAISSIIPYMNKQTNFYLSEVDYGFYTVLDKWLDAEIKGPGVTNASYGSLSGGEGRGIDIALQFAFLDVARLQAGIFPDYLTFDELLDSSIDSKGITELFKIIKTRQKDDESKIFIISHRTELEDAEEIDNVYHVVKENGYSRLEIK